MSHHYNLIAIAIRFTLSFAPQFGLNLRNMLPKLLSCCMEALTYRGGRKLTDLEVHPTFA